MSFRANTRTESAPEFWHDAKEHNRKIAQSVNGILNGQTNNIFVVTLEADTTSTTVQFPPARAGGSVLITAQDSTAATLARTSDIYAVSNSGEVEITHGTASGGETFSVLVAG